MFTLDKLLMIWAITKEARMMIMTWLNIWAII